MKDQEPSVDESENTNFSYESSFACGSYTEAACSEVVNGMENTRDFQFPPTNKAKISEYASNYAVSNYA